MPLGISSLWTLGFNSCFIARQEFFSLILELRLLEFKDLEVKIIGGCFVSHHENDCYELICFCRTKLGPILWLALKVR